MIAVCGAAGCTLSISKTDLPRLTPPAPAFQATLEHTVGTFSFVIGGGAERSGSFEGQLLSEEIMSVWKERGYVRAAQFVEAGAFTGTADYQLILGGNEHNDTSFFLQVLHALTLTLSPYTVTQTYDVHYVLQDTRDGAEYTAKVTGADQTWVELFLLLALPWAEYGHHTTVERIAEHLYQQFHDVGAFQLRAAEPDAQGATQQPIE